jgi:hypothetical protein
MTKAPISNRETVCFSPAVAPISNRAPTTAETTKAIKRLRGEREAYNKARGVAALEAEERDRLKLQDSFDAGFHWAHSASYETLKNAALDVGAWSPQGALPIQPGERQFQAGAIAFFKLLPKD